MPSNTTQKRYCLEELPSAMSLIKGFVRKPWTYRDKPTWQYNDVS